MRRYTVAVILLGLIAAHANPARAVDAAQGELQRMKYNNPGLVVDLGVGLWAWPLPLDYDGDGDLDLVVSCPDVPYNGTYFFENPGGEDSLPVFEPGVLVGPGMKNVSISYPDGQPRVLTPGQEWIGFGSKDQRQQKIGVDPNLGNRDERIRANQWSYVDYDGDGALDLIVAQGHWREYGWDNAFDAKGNWTRGPLRGYVYLLRNTGTTEAPDYAAARRLTADGAAIDVFGMPSPNFADFDSDGDLDLLCGDFLDGFTYFQNIGTRTEPDFASGRELVRGAQPLEMPLCMIVPVAVDWDRDGDQDLVVGQEDGRVALVEHTGQVVDGMPVFAEPKFFEQQADDVKFGALVTPVSFDWDGDGDEDLVCGNTAGEVGFLENLDGGNPPSWAAPRLLKADGQTIRILAGPNGSIQGPAEEKWGYTTLDVADWNHDGLPDIVVNSIWGKVEWFRNVGSRRQPRLAAREPIRVDWNDSPPHPVWNWWKPAGDELVTQWRTTPCVTDWDGDGLNDLVMLDHEGYLALFRRTRRGGQLVLRPGERLFGGGAYDARHRRQESAAGPLRLNNGTAGASGRRKLRVVDWDRDGALDLLVNSENVNLMRQVPAAEDRVGFEDAGPLSSHRLAGHTTSPTTADWDGDGIPMLLVGAEDGFLYHPPIADAARGAELPNKHASDAAVTTGASPEADPRERPAAAGVDPAARPNVLFIAVDDLRAELGCYGSKIVQSPNIDRLAARGLLFERAYCQQAVCNPSRASLLTGLRPDTLNVTDLPTHFREHHPHIVTLPQLLKQHGYDSRGVGKIFHNWRQDDYKGDPQSWSAPAVMHYNSHSNDVPVVSGPLPPDTSNLPRTERRDVPDEAYFDGRIADLAVETLHELRGKPFFLCVGFWKPHLPFNAPQRYWDLYELADVQLPGAPDPPAGVPAIALHDSRELLRGFRSPLTNPQVRQLRQGYYAATSYVDAQVGKVLDELDRLGLRDETIVVFWSDHGFHLGEHGLWGKTSNFEIDARVPLILSLPNQKSAGAKTDALVELLDLYPTLVELCDLVPPDNLQGISLLPLIEDPNSEVKSMAMTQHTRPAYPSESDPLVAMGYSIRTDGYRYTEWRSVEDGKVMAKEFYDHQTDPLETRNVVEEEGYVELVEDHQRRMAKVAPRGLGSGG